MVAPSVAHRACEELTEPTRAVARAAGISRAWLYRDDAIRAEVDRLRRPGSVGRGRPTAEQACTESLRRQLEAARAVVAELRAENHHLREAVARKLGHHRAGVKDDQS